MQIRPAEQARVVQVVEMDLHGVIPDGFDFHDPDMAPSGKDFALVGAMAPDFGGRAVDTQVLGGQHEACAVVKGNGQAFAVLAVTQFGLRGRYVRSR